MDKPIPLTIISGFLGAGKTTLMNHILNTEQDRKIAVLVNDFGNINIDSELIVNIENEVDNTVTLTNGCICCTLRDDLLESIFDLLNSHELDHIIIEASGVSDPAAIALSLLIPEMRERIRLENIITIIDAENIDQLTKGQNAELGIAQISVADILILNKIDLVDQKRLDKIRKGLMEILPTARIVEAVNGRVSSEIVFGLGNFNPDRLLEKETMDIHVHSKGSEEHHHTHSDHQTLFSTWSFETDKILSYETVRKTLKSLPTTIFRAKGILYLDSSPEQRGVIHLVGQRCSLSWGNPWNEEKPYSKFILIGTPEGVDPNELKDHFDRCVLSENSSEAGSISS